MSERLDNNLNQLNTVLKTVTEALEDISKKREEQTKSISDMSQRFESRSNNISEKCNTLEKKIRRVENDNMENINKNMSLNKSINSNFDKRFISLEEKIIKMEESLHILQTQYEENNKLLDKLRPKVGKKRKWWQVI